MTEGKRSANEAMMEARLRRLSAEARRLFEEAERQVAGVADDADQEELMGDIVQRMNHLDERDRTNLADALAQRVHEKRIRSGQLGAEAEDLRHAGRLAERAAELEGVDADSMTIGRAIEVLERHGEPFPAGLAERVEGMEFDGEKSRPSERREIPTFYPDFSDSDTFIRWDGSAEAEAWADLLEMRAATLAHAVVSAAVAFSAVGEDTGKRVDLEGLSTLLWSTTSDEIAQIVNANREEIARQVDNLGEETP
ncbi:hypothetical protein BH24ACT18_BH24ACT18_04130 [soil metagenome]|jgi:hypothetical protein